MSRDHAIASICVYCGSSSGHDPAFARAATQLGRAIAARGLRLVYGGGDVGLMGTVADAVMDAGGAVTGIIPTKLFSREVAHRGITELVEVSTMHERKTAMFDAADAFVALPGGLGTLEELAEILTWSQIGVHDKPVGVLDVDGYWDPLFAWFDGAVDSGFMKAKNLELLLRSTEVEDLLDRLGSYDPPRVEKWLGPEEV